MGALLMREYAVARGSGYTWASPGSRAFEGAFLCESEVSTRYRGYLYPKIKRHKCRMIWGGDGREAQSRPFSIPPPYLLCSCCQWGISCSAVACPVL